MKVSHRLKRKVRILEIRSHEPEFFLELHLCLLEIQASQAFCLKTVSPYLVLKSHFL